MINSKSGGHAFKIFREALAGYAFGIGGLVAGTIIAFKLNVFSISSWSVAVYPAILSARGIIGGLFGGRLGTALHLGTVFPRIFKNTKEFHMLLRAVVTLTFGVSVIMSLFSMIFGTLFWGATLVDFLRIFIIILATMTLGLSIALVTVGVSFISFKYGLDPDVFLYPAVSAFSDIIITSFYILILSLFFSSNPLGLWLVVLLAVSLTILTIHIFQRNFGDRSFMKTLKKSFITLLLVAIIVNITGTVLKGINLRVLTTGKSEVLVVYPALIAIIGSLGAIIGSTATTKLAIGLLNASLSDIRYHITEVLSAWTPSILIFVLLSLLSLNLYGKFSIPLFLRFTSMLLFINIIAAIAIIFVSFATAILTFQKGLDPDNFVIPIESVLADGMTSVSLLVALFLIG